ncbi:MAG: 50S ribosomal protein L21 [Thermoleophilia bacterium]|nr:50S ribosomal protein L21 [Thermoleophilia bacterium]
MFAIVDIGGKQYRAEIGREIVVDRLAAEQGATVEFAPILVSSDDGVTIGETAPKVKARVVEHLRGPKLVVFKFKPKRGFKRKNGFRSALTRLEIDTIG